MSISIYLDSSDFSDLSAPDTEITEDNRKIIAALRAGRRNNSACFYLSGVHLSEAVHATDTPSHKEAAVRRAALMEELCEKPFLRMPHEIMRIEIQKAISGAHDAKLSGEELFSGKTEWFGLAVANGLDLKRRSAMEEFEKRAKHLPRLERRKLKSEWNLSTSHGRARWRSAFRESSPPLAHEFPFNLVKQEVVAEWIVGDITDNEYIEQIVAVANSPKAMVESVLDSTNERKTIYSILRNEGARQKAAMETRLIHLVESLMQLPHRGQDFGQALRRALNKGSFYRTVVSGFGEISSDSLSDADATRIATACPAVFAFTNVYIAYAYSLFDSNIQRIQHGGTSILAGKTSDFGDLMHAVYAPYCDIFRCDGHFGALLKQDASIRSKIADKRHRLFDLGLHAAA